MQQIFGVFLVGLLLVSGLLSLPAKAAEPKNKGLFITPVREYMQVAAGKTVHSSMTVANITDKPVVIQLSVEQFTVSDFTYDYMFTPSKKDWVKLSTTSLELQANKSQQVAYTIAPPADAAPGGYYFTVFASKTLENDTTRKVRVGEALYVTVEGDADRSSYIKSAQMPFVSFGNVVPFSMDIKSTGNVHFLAYVSGKLEGIFTAVASQEKAHIVMPNTTRTIKDTIPAPLWPGLYKATYGYKVDDGQVITKNSYLLFLPPWCLLLVAGVAWMAIVLWRRRQRLRFTKK